MEKQLAGFFARPKNPASFLVRVMTAGKLKPGIH